MNVRFQRVRNVAGIVALAAVATAASLGVAEIAVRAFNVGPRILVLNHGNYRLSGDLILRYELAPGSPDGDTVISSGGLRDREFSVAKPPRTFRTPSSMERPAGAVGKRRLQSQQGAMRGRQPPAPFSAGNISLFA